MRTRKPLRLNYLDGSELEGSLAISHQLPATNSDNQYVN